MGSGKCGNPFRLIETGAEQSFSLGPHECRYPDADTGPEKSRSPSEFEGCGFCHAVEREALEGWRKAGLGSGCPPRQQPALTAPAARPDLTAIGEGPDLDLFQRLPEPAGRFRIAVHPLHFGTFCRAGQVKLSFQSGPAVQFHESSMKAPRYLFVNSGHFCEQKATSYGS